MRGIMVIYDENKKEIKKYNMGHVKYMKDLIVERSIEKFGDDDPCIIHETYCVNYIVKELMDIIEADYREMINNKVSVDELKGEIRRYVDWGMYPEARYVKYL